MSLAVEAFAPTYGLSIWTLRVDEPPRVKWAEGLNDSEIDEAEHLLTEASRVDKRELRDQTRGRNDLAWRYPFRLSVEKAPPSMLVACDP